MLTTKKWLCILLILVVALLAVIWFMYEKSTENTKGKIATITLNGEIVEVVSLGDVEKTYSIEVEGETYKNVVQVENGKIWVSEANCPDQICVEQGCLSSSLQPIVCLPNKMTIVLSNAPNENLNLESVNLESLNLDAVTN